MKPGAEAPGDVGGVVPQLRGEHAAMKPGAEAPGDEFASTDYLTDGSEPQ